MRSVDKLAYVFQTVDTANAFAADLRKEAKRARVVGGPFEDDEEGVLGSLHALLDESGSEMGSVRRRERVVRAVLTVLDNAAVSRGASDV